MILHVLGLVLLLRYGFLTYLACSFTIQLLDDMPLTADFSTWYAGISGFTLSTLIALMVYGAAVTTGISRRIRNPRGPE